MKPKELPRYHTSHEALYTIVEIGWDTCLENITDFAAAQKLGMNPKNSSSPKCDKNIPQNKKLCTPSSFFKIFPLPSPPQKFFCLRIVELGVKP